MGCTGKLTVEYEMLKRNI